jgi:hypothetical protein
VQILDRVVDSLGHRVAGSYLVEALLWLLLQAVPIAQVLSKRITQHLSDLLLEVRVIMVEWRLFNVSK